ncbi:MAG TPA: NAD(P)H-dependent oxidoreductase subunit E [Chitinophagaceae bacterium]|nr:NAD(P)H-dependent oxidoreductase subunit E [Chitinophagaceae bacterium]
MKQATPIADVETTKADPRIKLIAAKIRKENYRPEALIEILHTAQNAYGYLPVHVLSYITKSLRLPPSRVFAAVTFYHFFSLKSKGEHTCLVCTGTACYVKGAQAILQELEKQFGIKAGQVTADEKLGIQVARCVGACGLAPVVVVDDEVEAKVSADLIVSEIRAKIMEHEPS